jgi:hypothetical protein
MGIIQGIKDKIILAGAQSMDKQIDGTKIAKDLMLLARSKFGEKAAKGVAEGPISNVLHEIKVGLWADKKALAAHYRHLAATLEQTSAPTAKK